MGHRIGRASTILSTRGTERRIQQPSVVPAPVRCGARGARRRAGVAEDHAQRSSIGWPAYDGPDASSPSCCAASSACGRIRTSTSPSRTTRLPHAGRAALSPRTPASTPTTAAVRQAPAAFVIDAGRRRSLLTTPRSDGSGMGDGMPTRHRRRRWRLSVGGACQAGGTSCWLSTAAAEPAGASPPELASSCPASASALIRS